jgi:hypothetical protein
MALLLTAGWSDLFKRIGLPLAAGNCAQCEVRENTRLARRTSEVMWHQQVYDPVPFFDFEVPERAYRKMPRELHIGGAGPAIHAADRSALYW